MIFFPGYLTDSNEFCSVCILKNIINDIHQNIYKKCDSFSQLAQASAVPLARQIKNISRNFIQRQQEDPHEFLIALFNHLMQCISCDDVSSHSIYLSNQLHLLVGANIQSSITCSSCLNKHCTENYESVLSISITQCSNLKEALKQFCAKEILTNDNSVYCSICNAVAPATKTLQLIGVSPVIFIHLKRFVYDQKAKITRKVKKPFSYPELFDIGPFMEKNTLQINQNGDEMNHFIYQLYAVVVHLGENANRGHIFSYIRTSDDTWHKADDELVTSTTLDCVLQENNSYILCYSRLSKEKINYLEEEEHASSTQSSPCLLTSTPKDAGRTSYKILNDYSSVRID